MMRSGSSRPTGSTDSIDDRRTTRRRASRGNPDRQDGRGTVTASKDLEHADIIWVSDPLSDKHRPMLIPGVSHLLNYRTQFITILLSTKTDHEEALTQQDILQVGRVR